MAGSTRKDNVMYTVCTNAIIKIFVGDRIRGLFLIGVKNVWMAYYYFGVWPCDLSPAWSDCQLKDA